MALSLSPRTFLLHHLSPAPSVSLSHVRLVSNRKWLCGYISVRFCFQVINFIIDNVRFPPASEPPTALGRYRLLSPHAGVNVSPLVLGAMSIGDKWGPLGMGEVNKESSFKLLDAYYEAGGNFIDTANN